MTAMGIARSGDRVEKAPGHGAAHGVLGSFGLAALALTLAGVFWVSLGTSIAETGLRINQTVTARQALLTRRAAARLHLAQLTHPDALDTRARAMGFGPRHDEGAMAIVIAPGTQPVPAIPVAQRPLAFRMNARAAAEIERSTGTLLGIFRREKAAR